MLKLLLISYMQLLSDSKPLENTCAVYEPSLKYRWSARSCLDKLRFICQHKMPKVSEGNRYRIYNRWNVTYPNALANEVVLEIIDDPRSLKDRRYVDFAQTIWNLQESEEWRDCKFIQG